MHKKVLEELSQAIANKGEVGKIAIYDGKESTILVDFGDPKGGNIIVEGDFYEAASFEINTRSHSSILEGVHQKLKTNLYYSIKGENEDLSLELKTLYNFNTHKISEYSKDTVILIPDQTLRKVVQTYMQYEKQESVIILKRGTSSYIIPTPKEIVGMVGDKNINEMTEKQKTSHEKNDLKVYETPSNILETVLRAADYSAFDAHIDSEIGNRIASIVSSSRKSEKNMEMFFREEVGKEHFINENMFYRDAARYLTYKMLKAYRHPVKNSIFDDPEKTKHTTGVTHREFEAFHEFVFRDDESGLGDKRVMAIFEYIENIIKNSREEKNPFATMISDPEAHKKIVGRGIKGSDILFFDPQAGSAEAFFDASDKVGLGNHIKMFGTELRDDIDYGKNEERADVLGGVNTSLMANTISNTFFNKTYATAVSSMITWNNPPYSLDDGIAKASLDMYKNGTLILGLYPVKMRSYLKNTLDEKSIIVEVPKSLTGYEDENTPERFLVVAGNKFTKEAEARELGEEAKGLFSHATNQSITEVSLKNDATHEDLLQVLNRHFYSTQNTLGSRVIRNMEYYDLRDWREENIIKKSIAESIDGVKGFYQNAEKLHAVMQGDETKTLFNKAIQPLQIAKTEKVFLDTRFYSESGEYNALDFNEVISNVPLMIYYAKSKPKIMDIIEIIAKEKEISLPIDRETINTRLFKVGERYSGEKTKVATDKLGMMKFNFFPSDFDVQDKMSRENILMVLKSIFKDHGVDISKNMEAYEKAFRNSNILTTKTENHLSINPEIDEYFVQNQECLVLEGDSHSVKLNVSIFDFYNKLEELEFFDLSDYIEVVTLSAKTKGKIIEGFVDYIENVTIGDITNKLGINRDDFLDKIEEHKKRLHEKGLSATKVAGEINKIFNLSSYVEGYFERTKKMDIAKNVQPILEKYFGDDFNISERDGRKKMRDFVSVLEDFAQRDKTGFFESNLPILLGRLKDGLWKKYEKEERSREDFRDLDERMVNAEEEINLSLTDLEKFVKETSIMEERLGLSIYYTFSNLKKRVDVVNQLRANGAPQEQIDDIYEQGYDKIFRNWEKNVISLMDHQIYEPENFTELEEMRTNFMLKKMRTGKTLLFLFSGVLEMFTKKSDMEMYLNSANIKDIASQLTQHIPILLPSIMVYAGNDKHQFKEELSYDTLYHTSAVVNPLPIKDLSRQILGGGAEVERLANNFSKEIDLIEKALNKKYPNGVTLDDMLRDYSDSPFIRVIEKAKKMCQDT